MKCKIELSSGKVFSDLRLSGDCYVSGREVKAEDFAGGLKHVKVECTAESEGESSFEYELEYPELGGVKKLGSEWYIWLKATSEEARAVEKARADVEYLAMMTGVEL